MLVFSDNCDFSAESPAIDRNDASPNEICNVSDANDKPQYALSSGCLVTKHDLCGDVSFEFPVASECVFDINCALCEIENYCADNFIPPVFSFVDSEKLTLLRIRYSKYDFSVSDESNGEKLFDFRPLSEIYGRIGFPEIKTERLVLSLLSDFDAEDYDALCRDDGVNKYWGYDYRTDCPFPAPDYFLNDVQKDLNEGISLSYGVHLNGKLIGECVFHGFNCRGTANAGIRLFEKIQGKGMGTEAFSAFLRFGFDELGLDCINAKCFEENRRSYNLLSRCMIPIGEENGYNLFAVKRKK